MPYSWESLLDPFYMDQILEIYLQHCAPIIGHLKKTKNKNTKQNDEE